MSPVKETDNRASLLQSFLLLVAIIVVSITVPFFLFPHLGPTGKQIFYHVVGWPGGLQCAVVVYRYYRWRDG